MKPLYAVTVVFNPRRFRSRVNLYRNFAKWVADSGVKLMTVEVAYGERPFEVTDADNPWHLQLRTSADLWHKERALNLGIRKLTQLDPHWGYVCYLDADVKILRDDWAAETVHRLQHYSILQMFGEVATLDPDHHRLYGGRSIARNYAETGQFKTPVDMNGSGGWSGWPGLGWAYRRHEFDAIGGLFDVGVTGSADTYMAGCYMGAPGLGLPASSSAGLVKMVNRYAELCEEHVRRNVSYLPGLMVHYWHGKSKDRGYDQRAKAIGEYAFDPHEDLAVDVQGLYKWRSHQIELEYAIRRSLERRNEDSVDL